MKHLKVQTVRYSVTEKLAAFETFNFAMDPEMKRTLKATIVYGGTCSLCPLIKQTNNETFDGPNGKIYCD